MYIGLVVIWDYDNLAIGLLLKRAARPKDLSKTTELLSSPENGR